jgi:hypothetical protein
MPGHRSEELDLDIYLSLAETQSTQLRMNRSLHVSKSKSICRYDDSLTNRNSKMTSVCCKMDSWMMTDAEWRPRARTRLAARNLYLQLARLFPALDTRPRSAAGSIRSRQVFRLAPASLIYGVSERIPLQHRHTGGGGHSALFPAVWRVGKIEAAPCPCRLETSPRSAETLPIPPAD